MVVWLQWRASMASAAICNMFVLEIVERNDCAKSKEIVCRGFRASINMPID
jgi:hypothetical protein